MEDILTLTLPKGASAELVQEIQSRIRDMEGVEDMGELGTRGLEVLTIGVWVKLVSDSVGLTGKLVEVIRRLFGIVREKGIRHATVTVGTTVIELDEMSGDEFERMMARLTSVAH